MAKDDELSEAELERGPEALQNPGEVNEPRGDRAGPAPGRAAIAV